MFLHRQIKDSPDFWLQVKIEGVDDCWIWDGQYDSKGRCRYQHVANEEVHKVPRLMWEMFVGAIPSNGAAIRVCQNKGCVNPNHIFIQEDGVKLADARNEINERAQLVTERHIAKIVEIQQSKPKLF